MSVLTSALDSALENSLLKAVASERSRRIWAGCYWRLYPKIMTDVKYISENILNDLLKASMTSCMRRHLNIPSVNE